MFHLNWDVFDITEQENHLELFIDFLTIIITGFYIVLFQFKIKALHSVLLPRSFGFRINSCTQSALSPLPGEHSGLGGGGGALDFHLDINPFRMKSPKYFFPRGMNLYCIIKLATEMSLFSLQISKTVCLGRQNKI